MIFIGIDPGLGGGIAALNEDGTVLSAIRMPETEHDILDVLWPYRYGPGEGVDDTKQVHGQAVLERVSTSPQMGVVSAGTFMKGYGGLRMALVAHGIPFDEVTPQKWQKAMQCMTKGQKNITKRRAQELFPSVRITHAIADALLIAEYARRLEVRK